MIQSFQPGTGTSPSISVELTVECEKLLDKDIMSRSDPMCVLFINTQNSWLEVGRTEEIKDCLSPSWQKKFHLDYRFEERQLLRFSVYDVDKPSSILEHHDFLGSMECALGEIVAAQSRGGFVRPLFGLSSGINSSGQIRVHCEEVADAAGGGNMVVRLQLSGRGLDKKDWFGKSDPYLEIHRAAASGSSAAAPTLVYRSEVVKNCLDPAWKAFELSLAALCNGDRRRGLQFTVWDWNASGRPDLIGSLRTSVEQLEAGQLTYQLVNDKLAVKKGDKYKDSGSLIFTKFQLEQCHSFMEFLAGGTQLNFTLAVDFTGSNGNPSSPSSLHYRDPTGRPNQYVTAIQAVGEIIQDYDSDKQFPALGFGARLPPDGRVSHEFFLSLHPTSPFCSGIEGLLGAYYNALHSVQLYGPTNFSPVINHVGKFAAAYQNDPSNYFVLLIITDGIITDMEDTKRAIIAASHLPLSIIIVGVGQEDFSAMDELDSDDKLLRCGGLTAKRDIVQFVELRKFLVLGGNRGAPPAWSKELLAKAVLAEIPRQLTDWMKSKGFQPRPRT